MTRDVYLSTVTGGRVFVMDFARWGMAGAQPRFQIDHRMVALGELAKGDHPLGPKFEAPYRRQFVGVGHPDAQHIAANDPSTTLALIARIRELEVALRSIAESGDEIIGVLGAVTVGDLLDRGVVLP
jgi:hypothetical protein